MSGRTRIAWCSALAVLLTSGCLYPLVEPHGWLAEAALFVVVVTSVGVAGRRLGTPRVALALIQLVVAALLVTVAFARSEALFGCLPGPSALRALSDLYQQGSSDSAHYGAPAPATEGLRLLLVSSVTGIALLVDVLAAGFQRVALAGLPLLALYSVGTGMHPHGESWGWFVPAAAGYLLLLLVEGHERVGRWGKVFEGPKRLPGSGVGGGALLRANGYRIALAGVAAALVLPLLLPAQGDGVVGRIGGGTALNDTGSGDSTITSVDPVASLANSLKQPDEETLLSYRTSATDEGAQYLRIVDLDDFDGVAWITGTHPVQKFDTQLPPPTEVDAGVGRSVVHTEVSTESNYQQQWLPMPYPATDVLVSGDWKYVPEGRTIIGGDPKQNTGGLNYQVASLDLTPTAKQLRDAGTPPKSITDTYLALPKSLPAVVAQDARQVTAGATTDYAKAVALQQWFTETGGFSYSTDVPAGTGSNAMADFLKRRTGFCVHFASTMAAMARVLGIPSRVAIGFTPGTQQPDGSWTVTTKDAHAWPELYFQGVGWVRFEPTPGIGVAPGYSLPQTSSTAPSTAPSATAQSAAPSTHPSPSPNCPDTNRAAGNCGQSAVASTAAAPVTAGHGSGPRHLATVLWSALGAVVMLLLLTPMLWRLRVRRSRLRRRDGGPGPGSGPGRGQAAARPDGAAPPGSPPDRSRPHQLSDRQVLAAWEELLDSAWDLGIPPDDAETPRRAAARIAAAAGLGPEAEAAAGRLAVATEQVLYAPEVSVPLSPRSDVRTVREALRATADRRTRLRAVILPPSAARMLRGRR